MGCWSMIQGGSAQRRWRVSELCGAGTMRVGYVKQGNKTEGKDTYWDDYGHLSMSFCLPCQLDRAAW